MSLSHTEILSYLHEADPKKLQKLWDLADQTRAQNVGDEVHLRGLIEISNYCCRSCTYCGINATNPNVDRYRMAFEEIMDCVKKAALFKYGTVVMQAGEDYGITTDFISDLVKKIKKETPLAVTLSLGERPISDLAAWKKAGADRYLIRFETSDPKLYDIIHPILPNSDPNRSRITILKELKSLGYEVGSGVMVGIPGQSYETLANDIELFAGLDLDMIGVGPYLPHPETPLCANQLPLEQLGEEQVPNTELMTYKTVALTRIMCPQANIPSTTALATINKFQGRELGLMRGANVVMPNLTPPVYRQKYTIYPDKACLNETADMCHGCMLGRIEKIGRKIGVGKGARTH